MDKVDSKLFARLVEQLGIKDTQIADAFDKLNQQKCKFIATRAPYDKCDEFMSTPYGFCDKHKNTRQARKAMDEHNKINFAKVQEAYAKAEESKQEILKLKKEKELLEHKLAKLSQQHQPEEKRRQSEEKPKQEDEVQIISVFKNAEGHIENEETGFIFDEETSKVIGRKVGKVIRALSSADIELCNSKGWEY